MSFLEAIQLANNLGIFAGGLGLLKWGLSQERRLMKVELKLGIKP
jgi:hypothetical protein